MAWKKRLRRLVRLGSQSIRVQKNEPVYVMRMSEGRDNQTAVAD
eukprot:SAG31_NODE_4442_length_3226_cov_3.664535_5_plen_44_part_00